MRSEVETAKMRAEGQATQSGKRKANHGGNFNDLKTIWTWRGDEGVWSACVRTDFRPRLRWTRVLSDSVYDLVSFMTLFASPLTFTFSSLFLGATGSATTPIGVGYPAEILQKMAGKTETVFRLPIAKCGA